MLRKQDAVLKAAEHLRAVLRVLRIAEHLIVFLKALRIAERREADSESG